jgi:hypothetical protein
MVRLVRAPAQRGAPSGTPYATAACKGNGRAARPSTGGQAVLADVLTRDNPHLSRLKNGLADDRDGTKAGHRYRGSNGKGQRPISCTYLHGSSGHGSRRGRRPGRGQHRRQHSPGLLIRPRPFRRLRRQAASRAGASGLIPRSARGSAQRRYAGPPHRDDLGGARDKGAAQPLSLANRPRHIAGRRARARGGPARSQAAVAREPFSCWTPWAKMRMVRVIGRFSSSASSVGSGDRRLWPSTAPTSSAYGKGSSSRSDARRRIKKARGGKVAIPLGRTRHCPEPTRFSIRSTGTAASPWSGSPVNLYRSLQGVRRRRQHQPDRLLRRQPARRLRHKRRPGRGLNSESQVAERARHQRRPCLPDTSATASCLSPMQPGRSCNPTENPAPSGRSTARFTCLCGKNHKIFRRSSRFGLRRAANGRTPPHP